MTENKSKCNGCTVCFQFPQLAAEVSFVPEHAARDKKNSFSNTFKGKSLKSSMAKWTEETCFYTCADGYENTYM